MGFYRVICEPRVSQGASAGLPGFRLKAEQLRGSRGDPECCWF